MRRRADVRTALLAALISTLTVVAHVGTAAASPPPPQSGVFGSDWPVYHHDFQGSGSDPTGTSLSPASPAWTSATLDGQIFGEPLVEAGRVIAATENNTVYALSANSGSVLWSTHIAAPVPSGDLPCSDILPTVGITSTPVIDSAAGEVFVVDDEATGGNGASHHLVGLNLSTGAIELDQVVDPPGSIPLNQLQRTALTLDNGEVLIGFGGNSGDCGHYHGWLAAVPESGGTMRTFEVAAAPGDLQGAIWMGGAAPEIDSSGNIWLATGNSDSSVSSDPYDNSDGVIELNSSLVEQQDFAPSDWYNDNANDLDLGSSSPALLSGGFVFQAGKSHSAYVMNQSALGGVGGQQASLGAFCGGAVFGGNAVSGDTVYSPCIDGLVKTQVTAGTPPTITSVWQTPTGASGPPILAGGLVWSIDSFTATLYGLDPATGNAVQSFALGSMANHFPTPTVADGLLLAASARQVHAFDGPAGLPPAPMSPPGPFPGSLSNPNLLADAGFQHSLGPWQVSPGQNWAAYTSTSAPSGQSYLETNSGASGSPSIYEDVGLAPRAGQSFKASVWLRSSSGTAIGVALVVWADGGTTEVGQSRFTVSSTRWTSYTTDLDVAKPGHTSLRFQLYFDTGPGLDLDGAVLQDTGIGGSGFEHGLGPWWGMPYGQNWATYSSLSPPLGGDYLETNSGSASSPSLYQDVAVAPVAGHDYQASVYMRSASGSPVGVALVIWAEGGTTEVGQTDFTVSSSTWQPFYADLDVADAGHTSLRFQLYFEAGPGLDVADPALQDAGLADANFDQRGTGPWVVQAGANFANDTGPGAMAGTTSLLTNTGTNSSASLYQDASAPLTAGASYDGSVFLRSDAAPMSVAVVIWAIGGPNPEEVGQTRTTIGSTWQQVTTDLDVRYGGHTDLRFQIFFQPSGPTLDVGLASVPNVLRT